MNLKISGLNMSFGANKILKDINLEIENAHSIVIIGPSGGGKSTLLRILAGLQLPSSGSIEINGNNMIFEERNLQEYRKTVGMVFQSYNLFPHLTAMENIVLPLVEIHKLAPSEALDRASKLLERFQLLEHAYKKPIQLSGGQQQRVAIARAIAIKSQFLLLDEPTSALDPELTSEVLEMIDELKNDFRDLVLVTHEMGFAKRACDYTLFMADGIILEHGPSKNLFEKPESPQLKSFLAKILEWH